MKNIIKIYKWRRLVGYIWVSVKESKDSREEEKSESRMRGGGRRCFIYPKGD
jgi:hypothetical protein